MNNAPCTLARTFILAGLTSLMAVVLSPGVAVADTRTAPLEPMPAAPQADVEDPHDVGMALIIPAVATGASVVLLSIADDNESGAYATIGALGLAVGPSLGHAYTGNWGRAAIGTGLRVAGTAALVAGLSSTENYDAYSSNDSDAGAGLALLGVAGIVGGTLYSFIDAPLSAKRENKKHRKLSLVPAPVRGPSQSTGWGAQMQMSF